MGFISGIDSKYLFDSHSKFENDNLSSIGTAVLLKLDTLYSFENYIRDQFITMLTQKLYTLNCNLKKLIALSIPRVP